MSNDENKSKLQKKNICLICLISLQLFSIVMVIISIFEYELDMVQILLKTDCS